ncbi:MAG: thrombospondin type 3 repeat-containing protein, partial [Candidatus Nomurabacteria bacterium]
AFFFGIVQFIWSARQGSEGKGIQKGTQFMKWGLIALFVMFSVWGIVKFAQGVFGIQGDNTIIVPSLSFQQSGVNGAGGTNVTTGGVACNPPNTVVGGVCKTPAGSPAVVTGNTNVTTDASTLVDCSDSSQIGKACRFINNDGVEDRGTCQWQNRPDLGVGQKEITCRIDLSGNGTGGNVTGADVASTGGVSTSDTQSDVVPDTPTPPAQELADIATSIADNGLSQNETIPVGERKYVYAINGNELGNLIENSDVKAPDEALNKTLWGMFVVSNPPEVIDRISKFEVYPNEHNGNYGFVQPDDQSKGNWKLGVRIPIHLLKGTQELDTSELYATFLHEGMHIVNLSGDTQIDSSKTPPCSTHLAMNRSGKLVCSLENSYLMSFIKRYWQYNPTNESATSLYQTKAFVSAYATTKPGEDIAETYAIFIAGNKPTDNSVASQKILFFYNFPELVSFRSTVRNRIGLESSSRGSDTDNDGVSNVIENAIGTNPSVDDVAGDSSSIESPYYGMDCIINDADGNVLNGTYDMSGTCQQN